jgi:regulator of replication initiation timing
MSLVANRQKLETIKIQPDEIAAPQLAEAFRMLLQLVESLNEKVEQLKVENQKLRDENNQLKGEQGQPEIRASTKKKQGDISSEQERKEYKVATEKKSKAKKHKIKIDRTKICVVDKAELPTDAEFKGYQSVVVQDIIIKTDNVEYKKEVYYSPLRKQTYIGKLPEHVKGEFGSGIKTLIYTQKPVTNVSEPKIKEFLESVGTYISEATISRILTKNNEHFHQEKADIYQAGLGTTVYQHIDDTSARVKGQNHYAHIVGNPYYTAYFTTPHKDRLSVLDILQGGHPRSYCFNDEAFDLLTTFRISQKLRAQLHELAFAKVLDEKQMTQLLQQLFPDPNQGKNNRTRIREAGAIAAYHQLSTFPIIPILLSDDAPQFKHLTTEQALCWVHDGRHYKKLHPLVPYHQQQLTAFRELYWHYYRHLLQFKQNPTQELATKLSNQFDQLFSTKTSYPLLDERIAKTKAKKQALLLVLKYPQLPLHNNEAELAARAQTRKRDVSLHTMTPDGTQANDTFLTIVQTAKKLDISPYDYLYDRVSKRFLLPSLAELIVLKASSDAVYHDTC